MITLTIAVPAAHIDDANALAQVLGYGPADALTYGDPSWVDAAGNLYSAACLPVADSFFTAALTTLERPEWDDQADGYQVNMAGAERVQALINLWDGPGDDPENPVPIPTASPDQVTAVAGLDGVDALAAMGLERVQEEQPPLPVAVEAPEEVL
jgi:hypothetical protein